MNEDSIPALNEAGPASARWTRALDRLDSLPPWTFTGALYLARWAVMLPVVFALSGLKVRGGGGSFDASALVLLFGFLVLAPVLETFLQCLLPWRLLRRRGKISETRRPWNFILLSASLMAVWHISAWPAALLPSFITGSFLAYVFAHFAPRSQRQAFLHTWAFHAAINLAGWTMIVLL